MEHSTETITPAKARAYLTVNGPEGGTNRNVDHGKVRQYAGAMSRGEWTLSHQSVAFDTNGRLIDGQHRLQAVILANAPVEFAVTRGCNPSTFAVVDTGKPRSGKDVLDMHAQGNTSTLAAITRILVNYDAGHSLFQGEGSRVTNAQILQFVDANSDLHLFVSGAQSLYRRVRGSTATLGAAAFIVQRANPDQDLSAWYEPLESGINLSAGDPQLALKNKLVSLAGAGRGRHEDTIRYYIVAFNAWACGQTLTRMSISHSGFPTVTRVDRYRVDAA